MHRVIRLNGSIKMAVHPVVPLQAYAFNLADVQLLDGSPFKNAMQKMPLICCCSTLTVYCTASTKMQASPKGDVWWLGK